MQERHRPQCAVSLVKDSVCSVPLTDVRLPADAAVMLIKKRRRKIIRESKGEGLKDTSRLQDEREAAEEGTRQSEEAESLSHVQRRCSSNSRVCGSRARRALLRRAAVASGRRTTEARVDGAAAAVGGSASLLSGAGAAGGHGAADSRRVGSDGILSTTGVVLSAVRGASIVSIAASGDALVAPLLADEVRQGLGVLGHIGRKTVTAYTRVAQGFLFACVIDDVGSLGRWLQADQGALRDLAVTPELTSRFAH